MVTFTHTISVFLLGLGVLFFQKYVVPDQIIPVLGAVSGLSIVAIGSWLLYQRAKALMGTVPATHAGHDHHHDGHEHTMVMIISCACSRVTCTSISLGELRRRWRDGGELIIQATNPCIATT